MQQFKIFHVYILTSIRTPHKMCLEHPNYLVLYVNMSNNNSNLQIKILEQKLSRIKQIRPFFLP